MRARATSVNPVDWKVRQGYLRGAFPHHLPIVPGWDVAGVVEAVGPAVTTGLEVGEEVWGYVRRDDVHLGAAAELVGLMAWQALVDVLQVPGGDRVLVHAASGGVGHLAVQIAVALGAEVVATASSRNLDHVRELGATTALDYATGPISQQLDAPVDAVLDLVGGEALADAPRQVRDPRGVELAATYPLEDIAEAHRRSEEGHTRGKIAVRI